MLRGDIVDGDVARRELREILSGCFYIYSFVLYDDDAACQIFVIIHGSLRIIKANNRKIYSKIVEMETFAATEHSKFKICIYICPLSFTEITSNNNVHTPFLRVYTHPTIRNRTFQTMAGEEFMYAAPFPKKEKG
jgi:hypothetical protein